MRRRRASHAPGPGDQILFTYRFHLPSRFHFLREPPKDPPRDPPEGRCLLDELLEELPENRWLPPKELPLELLPEELLREPLLKEPPKPPLRVEPVVIPPKVPPPLGGFFPALTPPKEEIRFGVELYPPPKGPVLGWSEYLGGLGGCGGGTGRQLCRYQLEPGRCQKNTG